MQSSKTLVIRLGNKLKTFPRNNPYIDAVFSPDGNRVLIPSRGHTVSLWETFPLDTFTLASQKAIETNKSEILKLLLNSVDSLKSCCNKTILHDLCYQAHEVKENDPTNPQYKTICNVAKLIAQKFVSDKHLSFQHNNLVKSAVFGPDGNKILTASWDKTAVLWNLMNGKKLTTFQHNSYVNSAVFSPDGDNVLTASVEGTAILWDLKTCEK